MRKKVIAMTAMLVLSLAAYAYAQTAQQNTYTVEGANKPSKAGSPSSPVNVSLRFGYTVGEQSGLRPSPIKTYEIKTPGMKVNTAAFPKCSLSKLRKSGVKGCPSGSRVGTGYIKNATGASNNPADKSIECNAKLDVVNLGSNRGAIYVAGSPTSTDPRTRCAIELGAPIPARWVKSDRGRTVTLEFDVPASLLHPLPTLDNAVTSVESTISGKTRRYRGKRVSFYQSIGGCKGNRRTLTVTFTAENGDAAEAEDKVVCKR